MITLRQSARFGLGLFSLLAATMAHADLGLTSGSVVNLSGTAASQTYYQIIVPVGATKLEVKTSGGTGNCDLYLRRGAQPTTSTYDLRGNAAGTTETVTMLNPLADTWYIMVRGTAIFNGVSLVANLTTGAPVITTQPQNKSVYLGETATLSVVATGTPGPTYQWRKGLVALSNGGNISGATTATLTISNAQPVDAGGYSVVATNASGSVTSSFATLTVSLPPPSNDDFANRIVLAGANVSTTGSNVGATSDTPYSFAPALIGLICTSTHSIWWSWTAPASGPVTIDTKGSSFDTVLGVSGANFSGTNDDSDGNLTSMVSFNAVAGNTYEILVDGFVGETGAVVLNVLSVPPPNDNFADRIPLAGTTVTTTGSTINATAEAGEPLHATYPANKSIWWSWMAPANGSVTVATANTFDSSLAIYTGSAVNSLTPVASDRVSGLGINGIRSSASFNAISGTTYQIVVNGGFISASQDNSGAVTLSIAPTTVPVITTQPVSAGVLAGSLVEFSVASVGHRPQTYQWQHDGIDLIQTNDIYGVKSRTLTLANVQPGDAGSYSVVITNAVGSVTSNAATLTVNSPGFPAITAISPPRQVVNIGQNLALSVTATGTPTPSYQWKHNGKAIAGATTAGYAITGASPVRDNGWYQVVVTNSVGSVTSAVVFVNVAVNQAQILAWGDNSSGQTTVPAGLTNVIAVAAGYRNSVALKADGTVVVWGYNGDGQTTVPPGLANVVGIAAGWGFIVALKADGTVVRWGSNNSGYLNVPPSLANVVSIVAGSSHIVALRADGRAIAWGYDGEGYDWEFYYRLDVSDMTNVVAVAAGDYHTAALKANGTVEVRGENSYGQKPVPKGLTNTSTANITGLAAGDLRTVALKADGTVVAWGYESTVLGYGIYRPTTVPSGLTNVVAIGAGYEHSLALKADGVAVGWGNNSFGQATVPPGLTNVVGLAGGYSHTVLLRDASSGSYSGLPVISTPPGDNGVTAGQTLTFSAIGSGFTTFQWLQDGTPLSNGEQPSGAVITGANGTGVSSPGDTLVSITITNAQEADEANYSVLLTNDTTGTSKITPAAHMTVNDPFPPDQTITFGALDDTVFGSPPITLSATASSGLPITFSVVSGPANLSGPGLNILTLTAPGTVTVRASQAGNQGSGTHYDPATPMDRTFVVNKADQTITFGALANRQFDAAPFALSASATSGLPVEFSIVSGPAALTNNMVTLTGIGTVTIRASQAGNSIYNAAPDVDRSFFVSLPHATPLSPDFDGDGRSEVLWRNTVSTQVSTWATSTGYLNFGPESGGWAVIHAGDFDGDGHAEPLWHNTSSTVVASWTSSHGYTVFGNESDGWAVINTGDFDGDGRAEPLWHNTSSGLVAAWTSGGGFTVFGTEGGGWAVINTGDFDGDGKTDALWHNTSTGLVAAWTSGAGFTVFGTEGGGWAVINTGDFDGDGKADVLWHNTSTGLVASWTSTSGFRVFGVEDGTWTAIGAGDFDGDGREDVLWRNSSTGAVASWTSAGGFQVFGVEGGGWQVVRF